MRSETRQIRYLLIAALLASGCGPGTGSASPPRATPPATIPATAPAVTIDPAPSIRPVPSPVAVRPGEPWLVFAWYPDVLYLVRPDGTDQHEISIDAPGVKFAPSWSADGRAVAFVMRGDASSTPNGSIWTANVDGSGASLFYEGKGECTDGAFWPRWSPDGSRMAMVCYRVDAEGRGWTEVSVLDAVSRVRTPLTMFEYPETVDNPPSWSPDGSMLTFEIITWDPTDQFVAESVVATVPVAGGKVTRLTEPSLFAGHPDWSPDGSLIVFNTYDTGNIHGIDDPSNVYVIAPDGSGLRQLSTASVNGRMRLGQPFWSADGSRIWVSVAYDFEKDSNGQFKNLLGWVDAATGAFHEIGTEGKRFLERPRQ